MATPLVKDYTAALADVLAQLAASEGMASTEARLRLMSAHPDHIATGVFICLRRDSLAFIHEGELDESELDWLYDCIAAAIYETEAHMLHGVWFYSESDRVAIFYGAEDGAKL